MRRNQRLHRYLCVLVKPKVLDLNGQWTVDAGGKQGTIEAPGQWLQQGYIVPEGEQAVYRRVFELPDDWHDAGVFIRFDAVFSEAIVEVNGVSVGTHTGPFVAFDCDVTEAVHPGQNELVVRVRGLASDTDLLASAT